MGPAAGLGSGAALLLEQATGRPARGRNPSVAVSLEVVLPTAERPLSDDDARLLLAASRHALYLEGGELDAELREAAAEDVRACHQDDELLAPSDRFFSPRFRAFFTESLATTAAPSG